MRAQPPWSQVHATSADMGVAFAETALPWLCLPSREAASGHVESVPCLPLQRASPRRRAFLLLRSLEAAAFGQVSPAVGSLALVPGSLVTGLLPRGPRLGDGPPLSWRSGALCWRCPVAQPVRFPLQLTEGPQVLPPGLENLLPSPCRGDIAPFVPRGLQRPRTCTHPAVRCPRPHTPWGRRWAEGGDPTSWPWLTGSPPALSRTVRSARAAPCEPSALCARAWQAAMSPPPRDSDVGVGGCPAQAALASGGALAECW